MRNKELTWDQVVDVHRSWNGISTEGGMARSLLCNQHKDGQYGDCFREDGLTYFVGTTTQATEVRALIRAVEAGKAVRVFEKLGVNRWVDHGNWRGVSIGSPDAAGVRAFVFRKVS